MNNRCAGRLRSSLLVLLAAGCFVISGALTTAAQGQDVKDPSAKRGGKGGRKKKAQGAGDRKRAGRSRRGPAGTLKLATLNEKKLKELYEKLDADSSDSVSIEEFKALPTVLQKMIKDAAAKAKARGRRKKADAGAQKPGQKRKGRRKKKDSNTQ